MRIFLLVNSFFWMSSITNWLYLLKNDATFMFIVKGLFKEIKDFYYTTNMVMLPCHIVNLEFTRWMLMQCCHIANFVCTPTQLIQNVQYNNALSCPANEGFVCHDTFIESSRYIRNLYMYMYLANDVDSSSGSCKTSQIENDQPLDV